MQHQSRLDIVIVNWNSGQQLRECLESIVAADQSNFVLSNVVVVDNASTDASADNLTDIQLPLTVIKNAHNRGFGAACNQGAIGSDADFILFLNPDTRLLPDSLTTPVAFMVDPANEEVGICGIQLVDENEEIAKSCARFPSLNTFLPKATGLSTLFPGRFQSHFLSEWAHDETRDVDQVMGAFFLVRRPAFDELRGFDERFFVYYEEVDFSYRASLLGYKSVFLALTRAFHRGGGTSSRVKARRLFYNLRSRILYFQKHFGFFTVTTVVFTSMFIEPWPRLLRAIGRLSLDEVKDTALGFALLYSDLLFKTPPNAEKRLTPPQPLLLRKELAAGGGRPTVDIVIVNWNSGDQLRKCLSTLRGTDQTNYDISKVTVVDNASTDGSDENIEYPDLPIIKVKNPENRGFGAACNQGAAGSKADYILFLNPDTELRAHSLSKPVSFMQAEGNLGYGICGIRMVDENNRTAKTCARFPSPKMFLIKLSGFDHLMPSVFRSHFMNEWSHQDSRDVDHVIGAFFFVRRQTFEALRGFDEDYFVYLEDLDFSYRAYQAGWKAYYLSDAQLFHRGGGSSHQVKPQRLCYSLRSRIIYAYKHFSLVSAFLIMLFTLTVEPLLRIVRSCWRRSMKETIENVRGAGLLWRSVLLSEKPGGKGR